MDFAKRLKEHRIRHIAIGILLVCAGLLCGVWGYKDWQKSGTDLGPVDRLNKRFLWSMESDGDKVLAVDPSATFRGYDASSGKKLPSKVMGQLKDGWIVAGTESGIVVADGLAISSSKVVDLESGASWPLNGSMKPQEVANDRIYGTQGGQLVSIPVQGGQSEEVAPALQAKFRQVAEDPDQPPSLLALSSDGVLVGFPVAEPQGNRTWESRLEFWPWAAEEPLPWSWPTANLNGHANHLYAIEESDSATFLQSIVYKNGALESDGRWLITLPEDASIEGLEVNDSRWVVTYTRFVHVSSGGQLASSQATGFIFGNWAEGVEGRHENILTLFGIGNGRAIPGDGIIVFLENGQLLVAHPGATSWVWPTLTTLAASLVVGGVLWPIAMKRRLHKTANGGTLRCLNCGKRRVAGIRFCENCGWRTPDEEKTAVVPKKKPWEYWDHDR